MRVQGLSFSSGPTREGKNLKTYVVVSRPPLPGHRVGAPPPGSTSPTGLELAGSGVRQGGVLRPVRQLKLCARVTPAATPPGPTDTTTAPAPSLLGRAMGTRDDEYDYLFKGEVMGSPTLHRVWFAGPGRSRGTRVGATLVLKSASLSPSLSVRFVLRSPSSAPFPPPDRGSSPHTSTEAFASIRAPHRCPSHGGLPSSKSSSFSGPGAPSKGSPLPPSIFRIWRPLPLSIYILSGLLPFLNRFDPPFPSFLTLPSAQTPTTGLLKNFYLPPFPLWLVATLRLLTAPLSARMDSSPGHLPSTG